jgi:hypothetical protein
LKFSGRLFRAAKDKEIEQLNNGTLTGSNPKITELMKKKGLVEKFFPIYFFLTQEEMKNNPDADPIRLLSVGEASSWIRKNEGKLIGQVIYSRRPLIVGTELMMFYDPTAVLIYGPANAYREARTLTYVAPERPKVQKKVFAPVPTVLSNSTPLDTSEFDTMMEIPKAFGYEKKKDPNNPTGNATGNNAANNNKPK